MNRKIHSLQALRAIAAWLVVADHALLEVTGNNPERALTHLGWTFGSVGVDVFFVISGFIMVHVSWNEFGSPLGAWRFLARRALRIVPLYWLGTLAALAYHRISHTHGMDDGVREVLQSLAFIPHQNPEGSWNPILPQGWTLVYEAFFYVVFAVGLLLNRRLGLLTVVGLLAGFICARPILNVPALLYLAHPIILLFAVGIGLGIAWRHCNLREPAGLGRFAKLLEPYGNASFAMYLIQGFVLTCTARAWSATLGELSIALLPVSLIAVTVAGLATFAFVERPFLRLLSPSSDPSRLPASSETPLA